MNDVIPLESEDWGLEDYAVEVRGFECLHFSELGQLLREDDEVWYATINRNFMEGVSNIDFRSAYGLY